jgi:acetyl esterase/lipase
MVGSG